MKKQFLSLSAAILAAIVAVALPSPAPAPAGDDTGSTERYPINSAFDKATTLKGNSGRYTSGVRLESPEWGISEVTGVQNGSSTDLLYHDITDTQLKAAPGETVTATILYTGAGMAGFAYIDLDNDGQFTFTAPSLENKALQPGQELAAYTRTRIDNAWYLPDGTSTDGNPGGNQTLSSFKVPETPGTYKMRFCTEWAAINPLGGSGIANDGGSIIDIDLVVAPPPPYKRTVSDTETNTRTQDATQPRYTNALTLTSPSKGASTVVLNQQTNNTVYRSLMSGTEGCLIAKAGETVSIEPTWSMNAMHSYIYVDLDGNGVFDLPATVTDGAPNGEMLSYSYLGGTTKNSAGVAYAAGAAPGAVAHLKAPEFTIPAGTAPGIYRLRYKIDWSNSNPAGRSSIGSDGGIIADVPLLIVDTDAETSVTITGTPSNGTATYESGSALTLTPDYGYTLGSMTATATAEAEAIGPENPSKITVTRTMGGPTIPSALMSLGNVTVDVTDAFAPITSYAGYSLIWNDEFNEANGSHPDMKSKYQTPDRYNSAWNRFISKREDLLVMEDGILQMYCKPNPEPTAADDRQMVSGAIRTMTKFSFKYGRAEARMRVHGHSGSFPAFWLMPNTQPHGWPASGEIDIFESINNQNTAYATLHAAPADGSNNKDFSTHGHQASCTINEWHVYGVEWSENEIRFLIDGQLKGTVLTPKNANGKYWPFNEQEFYLILNQSVGNGGWAANPDVNHTYQTDVDWVRVYQKTESLAPVVTFIDESGAPLAEQPATITAEPLRVSVTTNATCTITPESETLVVTPVQGKKNQFTISVPKGFKPTGEDNFTVGFTATYPAGNEEKTSLNLSIPSYTVTWPKTTEESNYYIALYDLSTGELMASTAGENAGMNSVRVVEGSLIRADYTIHPLKKDSYRIVAYGPTGNLKTSYTKGEETVDLKTTAAAFIPPVEYKIESDVELTAEAEYMPLISWEASEGVKIAVTANKKAVTSGSRIFKGAAVSATFTPNTAGHYNLKSISGIGNPLARPTITAVTRTVTAGSEDIVITAEAEKHGHVIIDKSKYYTITVMNGDEIVESDDFLPLGTEVSYIITPAEGYMITEVNGETLEIPKSEPITGSITVDSGEIDITATVETDHATADIFPENIADERIVQQDDLEDDQKLEDQPVHFIPADNDPETEYHTLTFHHNSEAKSVTLPASLHRDRDNPDYEFVGVSDNEDIASGRVFRNEKGAWKLEITRKDMAGETLIHIYWREKALSVSALAIEDEAEDEEDIYAKPLATVRVKVITPPAATTTVSHEVEEVKVELKPGETFNLSAITAALLDADGNEYTDADGNTVALPENYATKWVSDDENVASVNVDDEGNAIVSADNRGTANVKAVVYDTATGDIIAESEPVAIKVGGAIIVGIDEINADMSSGRTAVYDLSGRRITRVPAPGIYIINGVKTLVR